MFYTLPSGTRQMISTVSTKIETIVNIQKFRKL